MTAVENQSLTGCLHAYCTATTASKFSKLPIPLEQVSCERHHPHPGFPAPRAVARRARCWLLQSQPEFCHCLQRGQHFVFVVQADEKLCLNQIPVA